MVRLIIFFCSLVFICSDMAYGMSKSKRHGKQPQSETARIPKQCPFCSIQYKNPSKQTIEKHIASEHTTCCRCSDYIQFYSKNDLYRHYENHHRKNKRSAHLWLYGTTSAPKKESGIQCTYCSPTTYFSHTQFLIEHLNRIHNACSQCTPQQQFSSHTELLEHTAHYHLSFLKTNLLESNLLSDEEKDKYQAFCLQQKSNELVCNECPSSSFVRKDILWKHLASFHKTCGHCTHPQQFPSYTQLLGHISTYHSTALFSSLGWIAKNIIQEYPEAPSEDASQNPSTDLTENNDQASIEASSETSNLIQWLESL